MMFRRGPLPWLALVVALVLPLAARTPQPALADTGFTITVNTLIDEWSTDTSTMAKSKCSLREALQATVTGNPLGNQGCGAASIANFASYTITMLPGTYTLTRGDELPNITKKIAIDGKGAVTINGGGQSGRQTGIFIVASGELLLSKLKLQHGLRPFGGAIWIKGSGAAQVAEVELSRNLADNGSGNGDGGAVAVDGGGFICIKSKFIENTARQSGGAISSGGVQVLVDRCEFLRNHAGLNGGAYAGFGGSEVTHPIIRDSKFRENWVYQTVVPNTWPGQYRFTDDQSGGGAIYNKGFMELERVQLIKSYTDRSKGGGAIYNQGELRLLDVAITDSKARQSGPVPSTLGGAILNDSTMIARRVSIHGNEATRGGAIMNRQGGRLYLVNSTVADNLAITGGGLVNGYSYTQNGQSLSNGGGEVHLYHSTLVRANDSTTTPPNIENVNNNFGLYMANSLTDTPCLGRIETHGGNILAKSVQCVRQSTDFNTDLALQDMVLDSPAAIGLQGLANNGGANLPEAEFLSVRAANSSPAVDFARDAYCTDPALVPLFMLNKDQIQGPRLVGPRCDTGAIEIGTSPPQWFSDKPEGAGFTFPVTIFGKVWNSEQTLQIKNTGGGTINWQLQILNSAGGVYAQVAGPSAGGLGKDQEATLTFRCTPSALGWHEGELRITTDMPGQGDMRYPISCAMKGDPESPLAWRSVPPGPVSVGRTPPGGQSSTKVSVGNKGVNPLSATISWKDAVADTLKFGASLGAVGGLAQPLASLAETVTIPAEGNLEITVTCAPTVPGLFTNTLRIATNDPISPMLSYDFSCEGAPAPSPEAIVPVAKTSPLPAQNMMGMAISPDGTQLITGDWASENVRIYGINPASGFLSSASPPTFSVVGMGTITGVRYSPDGKHVYYSSSAGDGVVATRRVGNTLQFIETIDRDDTHFCFVGDLIIQCPNNVMDGARALDISPDGLNLYVTGYADDTLGVLRRDPADGTLTYSQAITGTVGGIAGLLNGPFGVTVSPDGKNVYVASNIGDGVVAFSRRPDNGRLRYLTHYTDGSGGADALAGAVELAVSPDGRFLYVASRDDGAVQIFRRDPGDGFITPAGQVGVGAGAYHIEISNDPEGERLMVALWTGDAIKVFGRDSESGALEPLAAQSALPLNGPVFLVSSPDDRHIYATLFEGQGVQQLRSVANAPVALAVVPASIPAGSGDTTLTVTGSSFASQSVVHWNGAPLATTFVSERRLEATVSAGLLGAPAGASVTVRTPAPGGGESAALAVAVQAPGAAPIPAVEGLSPPAAPQGGVPLEVTVTGSGFIATSQALLNGAPVATTYINPTTLLAQLEPGDVDGAGPLVITVSNAGGLAGGASLAAATGASAPIKFEVAPAGTSALPGLSSFQPASVEAGSPETWVTVRGHNFSSAPGAFSAAFWNGSPRETVVLDAQALQVRLSAEDLAAAGPGSVTVYTPGAGWSDPLDLTVCAAGQTPVAQLDAVAVEIGAPPRLLVSGAGFVSGAVVWVNGAARATSFVSEYVLAADIAPADLRGSVVRVVNPGAAASGELLLAPQPVVYLPMVRR